MKKFTLLASALFACLFQVNAQEPQFVSTEAQNRNVIIEEFTGRNCGYCPDGHKIANDIVKENPGRVWPVNIHCGGFAPTSYPNFNTQDGSAMQSGFNAEEFPCGVINRVTADAQNRGYWKSSAEQQLKQAAECNVAGRVLINKDTRVASITVETYYTANSASDKNFLTVMMLQDSILGSQGGGTTNPEQMIGNQYCHMHILRDIVTSTWGDEIAPTTAGSLVTKTYEYTIPEMIGSPNGVTVDLENLIFIAFVSEKQQGAATRPVLNVNELHSIITSDAEYYPYFSSVSVEDAVSCSTEKPLVLNLVNGGTKDIASLKYEVKVGDNVSEFTYEGNLPSYSYVQLDIDVNIPLGKQTVGFSVVEVNGIAHEYLKNVSLVSEEWIDAYFQGEEDEFKIDIIQDRYGNQITWELITSDNTVLASGGPYSALASDGIKLHRKKVKVPNNECIKFVIYDEGGNGINNGNGEGYYKIYDSKGNVVLEGDGVFEKIAYHNISTKEGYASVGEVNADLYNVFPNPVKDVLSVNGENMKEVRIFNSLGQLVKSVDCDGEVVSINVADLQNGMYLVNIINNNGEMASKKVSVMH